jgi:hypothetical protein
MRILKNIFRIISRNNLRIFHKIKCGFPYGISAFFIAKKDRSFYREYNGRFIGKHRLKVWDQDLISMRLKLVVKDPSRRCLLFWL